MSNGLQKLAHLNLVQKVSNELENHLNLSQREVAEFIIDLKGKCDNPKVFQMMLQNLHPQIQESFTKSLWKLISTMSKTTSKRQTIPKKETSHAPSVPHKEKKKKRKKSKYNEKKPVEKEDQPIDDRPIKGKVYVGNVTTVKDDGFFVQLPHIRGVPEGLVPRNLVDRENPLPILRNYVKKGDSIYVKLISSNTRNRLLLSMSACDQSTGRDLIDGPKQRPSDQRGTSKKALFGSKNSSQGRKKRALPDEDKASSFRKKKRRMAGYDDNEMWVRKQLIQAGLYEPTAQDQEDFIYDRDADSDHEEELDIEINEEEPEFLKHQTHITQDLDSVRVCKNPDGSMNHAAMIQSALAIERRDLRLQREKHQADAVPDMSKNWADVMTNKNERLTYQQLLRLGNKKEEMSAWQRDVIGKNFSLGKRITKTMKEQRDGLPIYKLKKALLKAVYEHDILIVVGQTGSGKTTQMTQYLAEAGYTSLGKIACTQPRRVAAMSVAKRVAEEFGCRVGQEIGYSIRFEDCTSPATKIKYMTDGMLLREVLMDGELSKYSVIILDEAHERTIHTDVLFALTKACTKRRNEAGRNKLKLIITSATLDAEAFSNFFCHCPIFTIPGRCHPVNIMYAKQAEADYVEQALITAMNIHLTEPPGDILIFLTGKEEIDNSCELLHDRVRRLRDCPPLIVLPVYSALPSEQQTKIFDPAPPGCRKCVVATNIAEASLTIDGVYFVIDPGFVKQQVYNPKLRTNALRIVPISQNSADQRAGRAGRTGPGKCYRLYTQSAYRNEMFKSAIPEIQRINLGNVVLMLKAMKINDIISFDFMDKPHIATLVEAMHNLYKLGALDEEGLLTRHGRTMAEFPLDPAFSKCLMMSVDLKCAQETLTIIAMLQAENIFQRPKEEQAAADQKKAKFNQPEGDHFSYLEVYKLWTDNHYANSWCRKNFVNSRSLRKAQDVRKQLVAIMGRYNLEIESCGKRVERVQKAICSGFFQNIAKRDITEGYLTLKESQPCHVHPSSSLFHHQPQWVLYSQILTTSREYMRDVMAIEPGWLVEVAPRHYKKTDITKLSRRKKREKILPLFKHGEQDGSWRVSRLVYRDK